MSPLNGQNLSLVPGPAPHTNSLDGAGSTITNIIFGVLALVVGMVAIWQAYRTHQVWHPTTTGTTRPGCSILIQSVDFANDGLRRRSWNFPRGRTRDRSRRRQRRQRILTPGDFIEKSRPRTLEVQTFPWDCLHKIQPSCFDVEGAAMRNERNVLSWFTACLNMDVEDRFWDLAGWQREGVGIQDLLSHGTEE